MVRILTLILLILMLFPGTMALYSQNATVPGKGVNEPARPQGSADAASSMSFKGRDSCIKCHETKAANRLNQPVLDWMMSVHATRGQTCNGCHGGNPEIYDEKKSKSKEYGFIGKPTKATISEFCGKSGCHAEELKEFKKGPHYRTVLETGMPSCTTCHGIHAIKNSSSDIIDNRNCSVCHNQEYATEMLKTMKTIEFGLMGIQENVDLLKQKHANVDNISDRLARTRKLFISYVHVFSQEKVQQTETIIKLSLTNLSNESQSLRALSQRLDFLYYAMLGLGLIVTTVLMVFTVVTLVSRRRRRREIG